MTRVAYLGPPGTFTEEVVVPEASSFPPATAVILTFVLVCSFGVRATEPPRQSAMHVATTQTSRPPRRGAREKTVRN